MHYEVLRAIIIAFEALTIRGGMLGNHVATKLISFGANGVNVFQSTQSSVTK
jgi:hypothetical protein